MLEQPIQSDTELVAELSKEEQELLAGGWYRGGWGGCGRGGWGGRNWGWRRGGWFGRGGGWW